MMAVDVYFDTCLGFPCKRYSIAQWNKDIALRYTAKEWIDKAIEQNARQIQSYEPPVPSYIFSRLNPYFMLSEKEALKFEKMYKTAKTAVNASVTVAFEGFDISCFKANFIHEVIQHVLQLKYVGCESLWNNVNADLLSQNLQIYKTSVDIMQTFMSVANSTGLQDCVSDFLDTFDKLFSQIIAMPVCDKLTDDIKAGSYNHGMLASGRSRTVHFYVPDSEILCPITKYSLSDLYNLYWISRIPKEQRDMAAAIAKFYVFDGGCLE